MNEPDTYQRIINTATLRRSSCFGFGRCGLQPTAAHLGVPTLQPKHTRLEEPRHATTPPSVPKALRPPQHLSKRKPPQIVGLPPMGDSVRPLCVLQPQAAKQPSVSAD